MYVQKSFGEPTEDRPKNSRRSRRPQMFEAESNTNTNNNADADLSKSNLDLLVSDSGKQGFVDCRSPGRSRKSKMIESMAANFEKNRKESSTRPVVTLTTSSSSPVVNGDRKPTTEPPPSSKAPKEELDSPPEVRKSGAGTRRGKIQREKRKLRQMRRSTGVVNIKDVEDSEKTNTTDAEKQLETETETNTQTNEFSPVSSHAPVARISAMKSESTVSCVSKPDNKFEMTQATTVIKTTASPEIPRLYTGKSNATANFNKVNSNLNDVEDLRSKLQTAELAIEKLRKKITVMDHELHALEEENDELKKSNKMLEDENMTMLRLIRR